MFCGSKNICIFAPAIAEIAQLVEHNLAKVGVAGSSPVFRSKLSGIMRVFFWDFARVVELVDTRDLKSLGPKGRAGSSPAPGTLSNALLSHHGSFGMMQANCFFHDLLIENRESVLPT